MNEYRCTRMSPYMHDGRVTVDIAQREGHYIVAQSANDALLEMAERFPDDVDGGDPIGYFSVETWKENVGVTPEDVKDV